MKLFEFFTKGVMNMTKEDTMTLEEFIEEHIDIDHLKDLANYTDEGQPQPFCTMEVEKIEEAMTRVLTACWNKDNPDTEEIERDQTDEEIDEKNGEEEIDEEQEEEEAEDK